MSLIAAACYAMTFHCISRMKPTLSSHIIAKTFPAALVFCGLFSTGQAASLYWDGTNTTADADGGTGAWNNTDTNWDSAATGGTNTAWNNATPDSAIFGGVAGTVTLGEAKTAASIQIDTAGYTITGSTLTLNSGGITVTSGANNAGGFTNISSAITLGASQTWANQSSNTILRQLTGGLNLGSHTLTLEGGVRIATGISGSGNIIINSSNGAFAGISSNNSFSGTTTINSGGILLINSLTNYNVNSGLGNQAANNASNLVLNGGTLRVQVSTGSSDRLFTLGANGGTLESVNTSPNAGVINFTNTGAIAVTGSENRTLTLGGTNTSINTLALSLGDSTSGGGVVSLTKSGTSTWVLTNNNTYTGATNVTDGKLVVNGSISNSSLTTVGSGATLEGNGTTGALTISAGGFHNLGNSPGIMETGDYNMAGTLTVEINGLTPGTQHDQVDVTGSVSLSGNLNVLFGGGSYVNGDMIFILLNEGEDLISGTFADLTQGSYVTTYGGFDWNISYLANSDSNTFTGGNDIALLATPVVPEPSAVILGSLGMMLLLRRRRN